MSSSIRDQVTDFIVTSYLFGDASRTPGHDESLVETGIVDSTGILELIEFLESEFGIEVLEEETVPENLDSIDRLCRYVESKQSGGPAVSGSTQSAAVT
jgi:acyl carrier protein